MKINNFLLLVAVIFSLNSMAQAPLAGCWHPDFIKDWVPEKDPDRKFNRSSVPLQPRIPTTETVKAHNQQFAEGQVAACLTMHPMCSQVPAQGAYNFIGYNPTYWQYLDLLVWWGGSAGEGIILPPSAPVIDAAHLSGVKVLGQIFFPPGAFGGNSAWTTQMNSTTGNGVYPYARKCAEIAKYYGFDGWFINSETITSTNWTNWVIDYLRYAKEIGLEGQEVQLYNMSSSVSSAAQSVARLVGGSFMVNYGGTNNTINAISNHTNEAEWGNKFESYYAGQEQSGSITANGSNFKNLFTATGHRGSINWFNPEEPTWKKVVSSLLGTPNASGSTAYSAMQTVFNNEQSFWTNALGNVTSQNRGTSSAMPGLATAIQERSAIQGKPFITSFSAGLGKHWFVNGAKQGTQDWYHRGMQTVMPTWRWWVVKGASTTTDLKFSYNWDDAYNIGTSVSVTGNLTNSTDYVINLYKTKIAIENGDKVEFVYKSNVAGSIKLRVGNEASTAQSSMLEPISSRENNGWTVDTYDLSTMAGSDLRIIALNINAGTSGSGFTAQLGQLGVFPANYAPSVQSVENLEIQNDLSATSGDLRIVWDHPSDRSNIHHYNVYLTRNGEMKLAGQTRNEGYYIPKFERAGLTETGVSVEVRPVLYTMEELPSAGLSTEILFPAIGLPEVKVMASKSLLAPNEEVTLTITATNFPDSYEWMAPASGTLVSQNGNSAVYRFSQNGKYDVTVKAVNQAGTTTYTAVGIVNVQTAELSIVSRTANGGSVAGTTSGYDCSSYMTGSNENPGYLIDDITVPGSMSNKWCAGGSKEHWTIITLNNIYELYRFVIYDCGNKENASDNLTHYKIFTSVDKVNWEEVLNMQNVPATAEYNVKDHYIAPVFAKYVKLVPYDPDKAITIRLWQFDVYGMSGIPTPALSELKADKRAVKTGEEVTFSVVATQNPVSYNWNVPQGVKVSQHDSPTGSTAKFTFNTEGIYNIGVTAINEGGSKTIETKKMISVSDSEELISLNKPVILSNAETATVGYLTDGITEPSDVTNRWNTKGKADYWVIIDLQEMYDITRFVTFDCRTLEPVSLDNINHYNIFTATEIDAQGNGDWQLAVRGRNAVESNIKDDFLESVVNARYVKFNPYALSLFETKVYEFEIYGKKSSDQSLELNEPVSQTITVGTTKEIALGFDLKGNEKAGNFDISVNSDNENIVQITDKSITENQVRFSIRGVAAGTASVTVQVVNGTKSTAKEFTVEVELQNSLSDLTLSTVKLHPNPVRKGALLIVETDNVEELTVIAVDGRVVYNQQVSESTTILPTSSLSAGIYIVRLNGAQPKTAKLTVN